jgi:hypothetical protein
MLHVIPFNFTKFDYSLVTDKFDVVDLTTQSIIHSHHDFPFTDIIFVLLLDFGPFAML